MYKMRSMDECPNQAVSEGDLIYEIDPAKCNECVGFFDEPRCISVCPIGAVVKTSNQQEIKEELLLGKGNFQRA